MAPSGLDVRWPSPEGPSDGVSYSANRFGAGHRPGSLGAEGTRVVLGHWPTGRSVVAVLWSRGGCGPGGQWPPPGEGTGLRLASTMTRPVKGLIFVDGTVWRLPPLDRGAVRGRGCRTGALSDRGAVRPRCGQTEVRSGDRAVSPGCGQFGVRSGGCGQADVVRGGVVRGGAVRRRGGQTEMLPDGGAARRGAARRSGPGGVRSDRDAVCPRCDLTEVRPGGRGQGGAVGPGAASFLDRLSWAAVVA